MSEADVCASWDDLSEQERVAKLQLATLMAPLEPPVSRIHDIIGDVLALPASCAGDELHVVLAASLIQRALNDLRSTWLLLSVGYTSDAGSVVAALWEHAQLAIWIATVPAKAAAFHAWPQAPGPHELAEAATEIRFAMTRLEPPTDRELKDAVEKRYDVYRWLCKIKHPAYTSLIHWAGVSTEDRSLDIRARPITAAADEVVKKTVLAAACDAVVEATESFAVALAVSNGYMWHQSLIESHDRLKTLLDVGDEVLPFTHVDVITGNRRDELRERLERMRGPLK